MEKNILFKRFALALTGSLIMGMGFSSGLMAQPEGTVLAGFGRADISPPMGTRMAGSGIRDLDEKGFQGFHDPLFVRAVYLKDKDEELLIIAYDLLFISREEADQFKGALGMEMDLLPKQILMNSSHNHTAPYTHKWLYLETNDRPYTTFLEKKTVEAALAARDSAKPMTIWSGKGETMVPMSRRRPNPETGVMDFAPNPDGLTYNKIPVCVFRDTDGKDRIVMYSVAAHLSSIQMNTPDGIPVISGRTYHVSADYPGKACKIIDDYLGQPGSIFLQGCGGCAKCGLSDEKASFLDGTWEQMEKAGEIVAKDTLDTVKNDLKRIEPDLESKAVVMDWPFQPVSGKEHYEKLKKKPHVDYAGGPLHFLYARWADDMIRRMELGYGLPESLPVRVHGMKIGDGLRMVGLEGEATAPFAYQIEDFYGDGVTFPLGYIDGCHMYLPSSEYVDEGGYEVESYWEYRMPAPLSKGVEELLNAKLVELKESGVD